MYGRGQGTRLYLAFHSQRLKLSTKAGNGPGDKANLECNLYLGPLIIIYLVHRFLSIMTFKSG